MSRLDKSEFHFSLSHNPANVQEMRLAIRHPSIAPAMYGYTDADVTALLSAQQKTALTNLLIAFFADCEAKIKAMLDAQRASMNTDP